MKKFKFRMETILKLKKQQEDEKKRVVGMLVADINKQQQQAIELSGSLRQEGQKIKQQYLDNNVDLEEVASYQKYVTQVQRAIQQRIANVSEIQKKLNIAREEFLEKVKETKILEKLKEKKQSEYQAQISRLERITEDDIAMKVFLSNKIG